MQGVAVRIAAHVENIRCMGLLFLILKRCENNFPYLSITMLDAYVLSLIVALVAVGVALYWQLSRSKKEVREVKGQLETMSFFLTREPRLQQRMRTREPDVQIELLCVVISMPSPRLRSVFRSRSSLIDLAGGCTE